MEKVLKNTILNEKEDQLICINCYSDRILEEDRLVNCCITTTRDVNSDEIEDDQIEDYGQSDSTYYYCNSCNTPICVEDIQIFTDYLSEKGIR